MKNPVKQMVKITGLESPAKASLYQKVLLQDYNTKPQLEHITQQRLPTNNLKQSNKKS